MEKVVQYISTNTYDTLNKYTSNTKNVWLVLHGIGYLGRFFLRHFQPLDSEENYIICPQAPSKYYKDQAYKRVGASWLTKENTVLETENVLNYIDSVIDAESIDFESVNFIVLGYSQGVSIATRWLANRKRVCNQLIMISGVFPKELNGANFQHIPNLKAIHTVGLKDELFDPINVKKQENRLEVYFPAFKIINHNGGHVLDSELFEQYL